MYMGSMCRLKPVTVEEEEEALGVVWHHLETGKAGEADLRKALDGGVSASVLDRLKEKGLVRLDRGQVALSDEGSQLAKDVTRRHRLAERLLVDVLDLGSEGVDENACRWEHILSPEATKAICTLLGHPRRCPHGTPIPPGECCQSAEGHAQPIVSSLDQLAPGGSGRIAYLAMDEMPVAQKLLSLGLSPGSAVALKQRSPSIVVQAGETVVALEESLARHIFVRICGRE